MVVQSALKAKMMTELISCRLVRPGHLGAEETLPSFQQEMVFTPKHRPYCGRRACCEAQQGKAGHSLAAKMAVLLNIRNNTSFYLRLVGVATVVLVAWW